MSVKASGGISTATKIISRHKQGKPVSSAVSINAVSNIPVTTQTTATTSTNATSIIASQPPSDDAGSTEKKGLGWLITWTTVAGLMCLINLIGGHPGFGFFMLIMFIVDLCRLLIRMNESKDSSQ